VRAIDTNVLIRFFMDDNTSQAAAARSLFETSQEQREPLLVVPHVLCELVWVLQASFRLARTEIVDILQKILVREVFVFEREQTIQRAIHHYRQGRAAFSDYLIGEMAVAAGCRDTVTFDKALKGSRGFTIL
jgi:predicted nucleic-acid-binding protein